WRLRQPEHLHPGVVAVLHDPQQRMLVAFVAGDRHLLLPHRASARRSAFLPGRRGTAALLTSRRAESSMDPTCPRQRRILPNLRGATPERQCSSICEPAIIEVVK